MARNKLFKMLRSDDKGISQTYGVSGVLSGLFRKILVDFNIGPQKWGQFMTDYLSDNRNNLPDNRRDMSSIQGNLTKELTKDEMTWKVFCKGIRFLQIIRFELSIKGYRRDGSYNIHSINVDLSNDSELLEEESSGNLD